MRKILLLSLALFIVISGFPGDFETTAEFWEKASIEDTKTAEFKMYPNPLKGSKLTIEINSIEITELQITNIAGKQVLVKKFIFPENKKQIQLENIQNGIYLIKVKTSDSNTWVKKLIVSKE